MTNRAVLEQEIDLLPPRYYGEVVDFVGYLRQKSDSKQSSDRQSGEKQQDDEIAAYQAMAADTEREQEAREWCNAYFGPALQ